MKILILILLILILQPALAERLPNSTIGSAAGVCSLASKQYLAGKDEESLALYQKAILKVEAEYGKNSRAASSVNYELGVRALALSKFDLAEYSFKRAIEANTNSEAARLMLIKLLRFRNKQNEAVNYTQQSLKKHSDSLALQRDLILCLQDNNPAKATQQAFLVNCLQNDNLDKVPKAHFQIIEKPAANASDLAVLKPIDASAKKTATKAPHAHKTIKASNKPNIARGVPLGLVPPPPPPSALGFPAGHAIQSTLTELKAKPAKIKTPKVTTPAKETDEEKAPAAESPKRVEHSSGEDTDFLLDWASVKKKRAK